MICDFLIIFLCLNIINHNYLKMKKLPFSFIIILIISITLVYSCSNEDVESESSTPTQYTLSISASEGGSISPDATGTYDEGTQIGITATPYEGYEFVRWLGSGRDNKKCAMVRPGNCRATFTINSDRNIQAYFQIKSD